MICTFCKRESSEILSYILAKADIPMHICRECADKHTTSCFSDNEHGHCGDDKTCVFVQLYDREVKHLRDQKSLRDSYANMIKLQTDMIDNNDRWSNIKTIFMCAQALFILFLVNR